MPSTAGDSSLTSRGAAQHRAPFASIGQRIGKTGVVAVLLLGMTGAGALWLFVVVPFTPLTTIPCPFEYVTGYECPGCGLQSSLMNLLTLRFKYVLMANLLSPVLLPLFFVLVISWSAETLFGLRIWQFRLPRPAIWTTVIVVVIYGVLRNIPSLNVW